MVSEPLDDYVKDVQSPGPLRITELETPIDTRNADPGPAVRYLAWGIPVNTHVNPDNRSLQISIHSLNSNDMAQSNTNLTSNIHGIKNNTFDSKKGNSREGFLDPKISNRSKQTEAGSFAQRFIRKYSAANPSHVHYDTQKEHINEEMRTPSRINVRNSLNDFQVSNYTTRIYPSPNCYTESGGSKFDFSTTKTIVDSYHSTPMTNFVHYTKRELYGADTPNFFRSASIANDDYLSPGYSYNHSPLSSYASNSNISPNRLERSYSNQPSYSNELNEPLITTCLASSINYPGDYDNPFKFNYQDFKRYNKTQSTSTGKDLTSNDSESFSNIENNLLSSVNSEMWNNSQIDSQKSRSQCNVKHECDCKSLQDQLSSLKDMFSEFKNDFDNVVHGIYKAREASKPKVAVENPSIEDKLEDQISNVPPDVLEGYRAALTIKRMLHVKSMNSIVPAFTSFLHKRIN